MRKKKTTKKIKKKRPKKKEEIIPTKSDIQRKKEFGLFAQWLALSPLLRLLTSDQLTKIGVDDPAEIKLLEIKTQTEFAKKFRLSEDTLTDWKKRDDLWELVSEYVKEWGKRKTPSVLAGFYRKAVSEGDAARVKLWLQYYEGFMEKAEIKHGGKVELEQKMSADPILKKAVEFYEEELKRQLKKGDSSSKHPGLDKKRGNKKRKRGTN